MNVEEPSKSALEEEVVEKINGEEGFEEVSVLSVEIREPNEQIGSSPVSPGVNVEVKEETEPIRSPVGPSAPIVKGYGLKKWRRIRRGLNSDGSPSKDSSPIKCSSPGADSSVIYKRRLSLNEPRNMKNDVEVVKPPVPSGGSLRSVEAVEAIPVDPELVRLVTSFSIGMDSDNSEERSSKSTGASVPKARHEIGFGKERVRLKNVGGRELRGQKGRRGGVDSGKKLRGDQIKIGKEYSQSSVESSKFTRRSRGVGNGKQSENSLNLDEEHSDEAQTYGEALSGYSNENSGFENLSREEFDADLLEKENNGKSKMFPPTSGIDPFVESIVLLQTAQEALETEIQKIGQIWKEASVEFEEIEVCSIPSSEANSILLNQEKELLQRKLEEALTTAKAKELKVLELEDIIKRTQLGKSNTCSTCLPNEISEMHHRLEFESLLREKIEAEIKFLILSRTTQSFKVLTEDRIALLEEQKYLSGDHRQMTLKLKEAENKVTELKDRTDELDAQCKVLLQTENTLKMQNKVWKFSLCFFLQLLLLCIAFGLFLIQMLPQPHDIVPT